jgi:predicted aspartyl protease
MRSIFSAAMLLCVLQAIPGIAQDRNATKSLYEAHRWFDLHNLSFKDKADLFYKAATEMAFHQEQQAKADLDLYMASHPPPSMEVEARELLLGAAFRSAQYQDALFQAQQILMLKRDAVDVANFMPTLQTLAPFGQQFTVSRHPSTMKLELLDQNLVLPVSIGKESANYILDNGFSLSGMSESEARRLGLTVKSVATRIDTMSGAPVNVRIAVAPNLMLGGLHLKNVAFYVLPDNQPPFNQLPPGHRGILGLQMFLALGHFSWQPQARTFKILPIVSRAPSPQANLAFEGSSIFTRLSFRSTPLEMSLDTGAQNTILYPSFAHQFPDIASNASNREHRITGVGGSTSIQSWTLPSLVLQLGDRNFILKPATVLLEENNSTSAWFQGNLGMSLLNQASSVDIDLKSMTIASR